MLPRVVEDIRRNHALEHATVSLLLNRVGPDLRVAGRASGDGFFLYADLPQALLTECVNEALTRLQRGEAFWAVTPHCGTNIATTGVLATLASSAVMGNKRSDRMGLGDHRRHGRSDCRSAHRTADSEAPDDRPGPLGDRGRLDRDEERSLLQGPHQTAGRPGGRISARITRPCSSVDRAAAF